MYVSHDPFLLQNPSCNIQNIWAYWQDDPANLDLWGINEEGHNDTYLDHFLVCSKNPTNPADGLEPSQNCMGKGGIPVFPYYTLGGFLDPDEKGFPENPDYTQAMSITIVLVVDNVDYYSEDIDDVLHLEYAKEWEEAMIAYLQEWEKDPERSK